MKQINKPIRISKKVKKELKCMKEKTKLKSYDAVLRKLIKKEGMY